MPHGALGKIDADIRGRSIFLRPSWFQRLSRQATTLKAAESPQRCWNESCCLLIAGGVRWKCLSTDARRLSPKFPRLAIEQFFRQRLVACGLFRPQAVVRSWRASRASIFFQLG